MCAAFPQRSSVKPFEVTLESVQDNLSNLPLGILYDDLPIHKLGRYTPYVYGPSTEPASSNILFIQTHGSKVEPWQLFNSYP